jgi:hypothetical protein
LVPFDRSCADDPATPLHIRSFRYIAPGSAHALGYSRTLRRDIGLRLGAYLQSPLYFYFGERALVRLVERERIDFVHAHWILPNGYLAARAAARTGCPTASPCTARTSSWPSAIRSSAAWPAGRSPGRATSPPAAASCASACCAWRKTGTATEFGWSPTARRRHRRDSAEARAVRTRLEVPDGAPWWWRSAGWWTRRASVSCSRRFRRCCGLAPRPDSFFGGGGELLGTLEARAAELGVAGAVRFTGGLSHPDVLELIGAGDVFVMPSVRDARGNVDGLPIVVLEAMAQAKPVVATAISGLPLAVRDGETGRLVPERDPAALATALVELLADPGMARRMGDAGASASARS